MLHFFEGVEVDGVFDKLLFGVELVLVDLKRGAEVEEGGVLGGERVVGVEGFDTFERLG